MQIIKNELSAAAQAGALDGSLAFSKVYTEHRDLVSQTALSGLKGLQDVLANNSVYNSAITHLQEATEKIDEANIKSQEQPFKAANAATQTQHSTATSDGLKTQAGPYQTTAGSVQTAAQNAVTGTDSSKPERTIANSVKSAADLLKSGLDALANSANLTSALTQINQSKTDAQAAITAATALRTTLQAQILVPTARIQSLKAVINAANEVINTANSTQALTNSPIAQIRNETPTVHDLGDGYSLSTWGDSGYMTLVDANGEGVIISPDGTVGPLDGSGEGWKFSNPSTFVLPNETKITIIPGNTASILVTRGLHALSIQAVGAGQIPTASPYGELNGRKEDRASNDGHIIHLNGNASNWSLNGQVLGDAASLELVATSAVTNELKLDPTDVAVSPELIAFLADIGGTIAPDYDGDGKLNNEELSQVAGLIYNVIQQLQASFASALSGVADANQALADLNQLLELMRIENDTLQVNRQSENADARAALQVVERRLVAALDKLRGKEDAPMADIESSAQNVLSQLNEFSQTGGVTTPASSNPSGSSNGASNQKNGQSESQPDPIGDGLRRASRLLSGLLGGSNLNILDLPPSSNGQAAEATGGAAEGGLPALNQLGSALAALGLQLDPQAAAAMQAQDLSAGLQALLTLLGELGVLPLGLSLGKNGAGVSDVLQQLGLALQGQGGIDASGSNVGAVSGQSLFSFLGTLAQLGSAINAVPQAGLTTAEPLALMLDGLAALGSAGAAQGIGTPTSAELSLGLQSFLGALAAFGVVAANPQQGQQSGASFTSSSASALRTISGNFATDPELLKQLRANLNRAIQEHQSQVNRASTLFVQSQEIVQKFVSIIKQDDLARDIVHTDELSDETQTKFDDRMTKLKQEWGVQWGSDNEERTPAGQSNLVSRAVQSGMMV